MTTAAAFTDVNEPPADASRQERGQSIVWRCCCRGCCCWYWRGWIHFDAFTLNRELSTPPKQGYSDSFLFWESRIRERAKEGEGGTSRNWEHQEYGTGYSSDESRTRSPGPK
jgi:hypothetical protein